MSKQKKGLKPALRFPEFQDQTSWIRFKLIDVADKNVKWSFIGGPFGSNLKSSDYIEQGVRIIQLQNIGDGQFNDDYKVFTSKEKADELLANNIYSGDIILSKMGDPVGRACIIPETDKRYVMCSDGIRLVVDEERHSKYFIYSLINGSQFRSVVESTATGSTRKRIGLAELKKLPIFLPVKQEQQKIADCLSSMDDLITKSIKKLESLKSHKKGLMQKLFPAEGKSVPELRFPEFTGKWNEKELGQLSTILRGGSPRPIENFLTKDKKALNWLKIGDVDKDAKYISMTQERVKVEALSKTRVVNSGDLIMSNSMSFGRPYIMKIQSCIHDGWIAVTDVSQSIDVNYLYYFILSDASQSYFVNSAAGGGIKNLNADIIKKTPVFYAEDIKEQKKIADTLSSIDDLITENIKNLESLKSHKKGLMQKLFPEIKESIA
ncbi:restriction endonuclease subunit S [Vibrio parahaemolyticus]|uniref:restriction endonuclease subunit S n=1 Tax=Vibrio parahaemolyticus TaxID=670 RepID=UPI0022B3B4E3|nr:restriction endonuclease subunit S [Vibrio parahaemolyticus]MCZ5878876.1 restriction endonuclease subunit S [Vibrio parahaemolyticus]MCZ6369595.1 restriction endonuclease subunit S [Vibrio parahaemolyticus]MDF4893896.1 restriction endonuclease subunit S [Vibrio parahaemolyticus]MDG3395322.1 restriction endonuclease subunit S [Vibrio parahaemolyticus]